MDLTTGEASRHKVYTLTRKVQVLLRVFNRKINASALSTVNRLHGNVRPPRQLHSLAPC